MDIEFYIALQDEIWRATSAIHKGLKPTIYRNGRTYLVEAVFLESDVLWFQTVQLVWSTVRVQEYWAHVKQVVFPCVSEWEWMHVLYQSGLSRSAYFIQDNIQTEKLKALTKDNS
jgi:hypothetical protein